MILNYCDRQEKIGQNIIKKYESVQKLIIESELGEKTSSLPIEVSLSVVRADEIREINREFRGVDKVTDVLSFPQYEDISILKSEIDNLKSVTESTNMPLMLGDVVICYDTAKKQSIEYGNTMERELVYLFVHSLFHLLGYDHINAYDRRIMRRREEEIMSEIGIER